MNPPNPSSPFTRMDFSNADAVLLPVYIGYLKGEVTWEQLSTLAAHPELARRATDDSIARLADLLTPEGETGDRATVGVASLLGNFSIELAQRNRNPEAVLLFDAAEPVFERHGLDIDVAACRMNRAGALEQMGRYADAVAGYDAAEPVFDQHGLDIDVATCRMNRAGALEQMGRYDDAVAGYDDAEPVFERHGLDILVARCRMGRAVAFQRMGRYDDAVAGYDDAEPVFDRHGLDIDVATCHMNRAWALQQMGRYPDALAGYDDAEPVFDRHGLDIQVARCRMNRAVALRQMGRYDDSVAASRQVDERVLVHDERWRHHWGYGVSLWSMKNRTEALDQFTRGRQALRQARRAGGIDEITLEFVATRGGLIHDAVRYAVEADELALAFEAVHDGKAGVLGDLRLPGRLASAEGDEIEAGRQTLGRWLHTQQYEACAAMTAKQVGPPAVLSEKEQKKIRKEIEAELNRETQTRTQTYLKALSRGRLGTREDAPATAEEVVSTRRIQDALPVNWALLDFWCLDKEQVKVFVLTHDAFWVETLRVPFSDGEVQQAFGDLVNWLRKAEGPRDDALYLFDELLFAPLRPKLRDRGIQGLYLVPHGSLHLVPMHACCAEEGHFLGDEFAIAYLPSSALLPQLPKLALSGTMLSLANPERGTPGTLPFSEWEAEQLRQVLALPRHDVFAGPEATFDRTAAWETTPVAHFSCHGSGHAQFAALSHLRLADDVLLSHDVAYRRPPLLEGSLAILNGCQTGLRDWRAVDEGMGLMSAFLLRGAGLVFATQWSVADYCAAEMVTTFLGELVTKGATPTESLRAAQRRARSITAEEVEVRCREMLASRFPPADCPHEAARLNVEAARVCLLGGNRSGARHYARHAATALRSVGQRSQADQMDAIPEADSPTSHRSMSQPMYKHPVYWSAFQLVGRVT